VTLNVLVAYALFHLAAVAIISLHGCHLCLESVCCRFHWPISWMCWEVKFWRTNFWLGKISNIIQFCRQSTT